MSRSTGRRPARGVVVRRWLAVGALLLIALLYYRPLKAYIATRSELGQRSQIVHHLEADKASLEQRLGSSTPNATPAREAPALGYGRQGEHRLTAQGIQHWRERDPTKLTGRP